MAETKNGAPPRTKKWLFARKPKPVLLRLEEQPARAEFLSLDQLERHARALANWHQLAPKPRRDKLLPRLADNAEVIEHIYAELNEALGAGRPIVPAAEWLLDNYYMVENQVNLARQHLPRGYSLELPQLAGGPGDGLPRVYKLAMELIRKVDGLLDVENLRKFVSAYQSVSTLNLGELWAIPIMLRLAIIENLRQVSLRIYWQQRDQEIAADWAAQLASAIEQGPRDVIVLLANLIDHAPSLSSSFVMELVQRVQGRLDPAAMVRKWLEHRLAEHGQTIDQMIAAETQARAADHGAIGNTITSLRTLGVLDWRAFVEEQSAVDRVLRSDPQGGYARMLFASRDRYRHVVEQIAKRSLRSEEQVARVAVEMAADALKGHPPGRADSTSGRASREYVELTTHVGYYLVDTGRRLLERSVGYRPRPRDLAERFARRFPLPLYLGSIKLMTLALVAAVFAGAWALGAGTGAPAGLIVAYALLCSLFASQPALTLVNWIGSRRVPPRSIERLDLSEGIPAEFKTVVVVPTMLASPADAASLVDNLELRYLGNRDRNLTYGLLTDFPDAASEHLPTDDAILADASRRIVALNEKYRGEGADIFFLFHRPRLFNAEEGSWMARERKRGKLDDVNRLLRGDGHAAFSHIVGDVTQLAGTRYVITLDTDTRLPRDAAAEMIGCMAHPLNRPIYDEKLGRVVRGYTILQPRVGVSMPDARRTAYSKLFAGDAGIDPYTQQVSDVYQDFFGEGSFIGKGIYDLRMFDDVLRHRFPDNRILSHDLIEGCFARSGLINNVELFEGFPGSYLSDSSRRHRWARGDWQVAAWILPRRPTPDLPNASAISWLSRWKLLDNLRRGAVSPALLVLLAVAWLGGGVTAWYFTAALMGLFFGPQLVEWLVSVVGQTAPWKWLLRAQLAGLWNRVSIAAFGLAVAPYEALCNVHAMALTLYRLLFTRRKLLQWTTSHDADQRLARNLRGHYDLMRVGPGLAVMFAVALGFHAPSSLFAAAPLLALWFFGPYWAWRISCPLEEATESITAGDRRFLRAIARRTWRYFATFACEREHWLAPDNYQEEPGGAIAARTSPTNIGMALLSNLAAYDLGYLPISALLTRVEQTFATLSQLERYRGHFFNWYDTRTLQVIEPRYVSVVDSGNLAGHLLALRGGFEELRDAPLWPSQFGAGLEDVIFLLVDALGRAAALAGSQAADARKELEALAAQGVAAMNVLAAGPVLAQALAFVEKWKEPATAAGDSRLLGWLEAFEQQCRGWQEYLARVGGWAPLLAKVVEMGDAVPEAERPRHADFVARARTLDDTTLAKFPRQSAALAAAAREWALALTADVAAATRPIAIGQLLVSLAEALSAASDAVGEKLNHLLHAAAQCDSYAAMDFTFLYDSTRDLFSIGFNASAHRLDLSFYDLLASEARLASYLAISRDQLPREHWFALGRMMTTSSGEPTLLSWSGSMFEYLMPLLVMPNYNGTLLHQSALGSVRRQIEYGRQRHVPWGISESCYHVMDANMVYQYRAFGVPGLGLQRGLADDLVIAPYATVMATMVLPAEATANLRRLADSGFWGDYGFFDAVDFTPNRLPDGGRGAPCKVYMAHHGGMSLVALANVLHDNPMPRRFMRDPQLKAHELLLQERIPNAIEPVYPHAIEAREANLIRQISSPEPSIRILKTPDTPAPEVQLLSNGQYHVVVTQAGGGYSRWRDLAVTAWREDFTRDADGLFCYVRDLASGAVWSTTHQPTLQPAKRYQVTYTQGRAEFSRVDHDLELQTVISVSPEDDIEVRRVVITNAGRLKRELELTTYGEVVVGRPAEHLSHRVFCNLFVETEILADRNAILCTRRKRSQNEQPAWMFHLLIVHGAAQGRASFESDRLRFIGRGRSPRAPLAMDHAGPLHGTAGNVLEPCVSIRQTLSLAPDALGRVDIITGMAETREQALALVEKYQDYRLADRVLEMARTHSEIVQRRLGASDADAQLFGRLAGPVIYGGPTMRADLNPVARTQLRQSGLWAYAISGDRPIVLANITAIERLSLVKRLVQAHAYWRAKGVSADLVILIDDYSGYRQAVYDEVMALVISGPEAPLLDKPGGVFVRRGDQIPEEDRRLLQIAARAVLVDTRGSLAEQLERRPRGEARLAPALLVRPRKEAEVARPPMQPRDLLSYNGLGGFTTDGREYVMTLDHAQTTPAPWSNVLANDRLGTVVTESGLGYTWFENAHEFRLSPWFNDPVCDPVGEAIYVRDEETGRFFSPTPAPAGGARSYVARHGLGYTVWEYEEGGIATELSCFVATDAPVKLLLLKLHNRSGRKRSLSVTGYVEWALGEQPAPGNLYTQTEVDPQTDALLAQNPYNNDFNSRIAFFQTSEAQRSCTCDRTEFLGRHGSAANPAAMRRARLSGRAGAGFDPCAALQSTLELADGQEQVVSFTLGAAGELAEARSLIQRFQGVGDARRTLEKVWNRWTQALGGVQVETPDASVNILANGWLLYQTLACRFWGRSGFYQSGGAFGFRDQLQDSLALALTQPQLTREHLLRSASRQFTEGDVQHWWHPPLGRGVRTKISDDYLWLPFVAAHYVAVTGDRAVLDERLHYLSGRPVSADEESYYDLPQLADAQGSLYEHCARAIRHGLRFGRHGLPLMGAGDWNDGMNLVGAEGQGESVWLAFFLLDVLEKFAPLARERGDQEFADLCQTNVAQLREAIESNAWDGAWYRRAYFDSGEPLGSAQNTECQIDSLPQAWAAITGAVEPKRMREAMQSVYDRLVRKDIGLIQLFDPPFNHGDLEPGYVKGYLPGVRENGGQYTHAAVWTTMAFALLGETGKAWQCFDIINPIRHGGNQEKMRVYKVEPYVLAADIYSVPPLEGRGGWTWYTGSAGWMYRLIIEVLLGLRLEGGSKLTFRPCVPATWNKYRITYRYHETIYRIELIIDSEPTHHVKQVLLDGVLQPDKAAPLVDDRVDHQVEVRLGI